MGNVIVKLQKSYLYLLELYVEISMRFVSIVSVCNLDRSILSTKTYLFIINFKENFLSKL